MMIYDTQVRVIVALRWTFLTYCDTSTFGRTFVIFTTSTFTVDRCFSNGNISSFNIVQPYLPCLIQTISVLAGALFVCWEALLLICLLTSAAISCYLSLWFAKPVIEYFFSDRLLRIDINCSAFIMCPIICTHVTLVVKCLLITCKHSTEQLFFIYFDWSVSSIQWSLIQKIWVHCTIFKNSWDSNLE
ncbi:unnamed protein product [Wuchereria bancrofti]|uniref:Uncharacterized protein n=1 Tax=Wuchereria bancrofti TaxID=6293 RepID=A0A3P7F9X8_WUCBA|nr:unnamed protein product [Wuchereria bancrofti]